HGELRQPREGARVPGAARAGTSRPLAGGDRPEHRLVAVELEGSEAVELRVPGGMEVGRPGLEQALARAALREQRDLPLVVGRVEDLDAVEPERYEALQGRQDRAGIGQVPERVRPRGHTARRVDRLD